jgi:hypothetical protein
MSAKTQILYIYIFILRIINTQWSEFEFTIFSLYRQIFAKIALIAISILVVEKMTDKYRSMQFDLPRQFHSLIN